MHNINYSYTLLIEEDLTYDIIGDCMKVHRFLDHGFLEIVYKDALQIEFASAAINFSREKKFDINYKGMILAHKFYADFLVKDAVIIEVKTSKDGIADSFIA